MELTLSYGEKVTIEMEDSEEVFEISNGDSIEVKMVAGFEIGLELKGPKVFYSDRVCPK